MHTFFKRILLFLGAILLLLGLTLAFLPTFLNTDFGKKQLESWINRKIPGSIEIRLLDLHWGKGQRIEGVVLRDADGQSVMGFEKLYTDASLWKLFNKSTHLGFTRIKDFNAALVVDRNNQSNLQKALGIETAKIPAVPGTISLSDVQGDFYLTQDSNIPFSAHLKGITREASLTGSFEIDIVLNQLNGADWDELKDEMQNLISIEGGNEAKVQAHIVNFPVDIIDQFLVLKGLKPNLRAFIGEKIDLILNKEPDPKRLVFNLEIVAPLLKGNLKGSIKKGVFYLHDPANFTFDLTQSSLEQLTGNTLSLVNPAELELIINNFQIPLHFFSSHADATNYSFNLEANAGPAFLNVSESQIKVDHLNAYLSSSLSENHVNFLVKGQATQNDEPFNLNIESRLKKPKNSTEIFNYLKNDLQLSGKVSQFPLRLIPFLDKHPSFLFREGEKADIGIELHADRNQLLQGTLSANTSTIQLHPIQFLINEEFNLYQPAQIDWIVPGHALSDIFESNKLVVDEPIAGFTTVKRLTFPLNNLSKIKLESSTQVDGVIFSNLYSDTNLRIQDVKFDLESKNISEWEAKLTSQALALNQDRSPSPLLNSPLDFSINGNLKFNNKGKLEIPSLKVLAKSIDGGAELDGQLTSDQVFIYKKPLEIHYLLTPQTFDEVRRIFNLYHMPKLISSSLIQINLAQTPIDFKNDWLSKLMVKGEATVEELTFQDKSNLTFSLKNLHAPLVLDARHNLLNVSLKGIGFTHTDSKPNSFYMNLKMEDWLQNNRFDLSLSKTEFSSHFTALPTSFVSGLMAYQDLSPILGPSLDIELKTLFDREQQNTGYWDMNIDSTTFHAKARLFLGESITLYESKNPTAIVRWTITPEGYHFLKKNYFKTFSSSTLSEPFTITVHLSSLNFPLSFNASTLEQGQFTAHLTTNELKLKGLQQLPPLALEGEIKSRSLSKSVHIDLRTLAKDSSLAIKSLVKNLIDQTGAMRKPEDMSIGFTILADQFPLAYFQAFNMLEDEQIENLTAMIGEKVDAEFSAQLHQLSGPIEAKIRGVTGQAHLSGKLNAGIMTLKTPFTYDLTITPVFRNYILKKNISFLNSVIDADNPIKLSIDPQGFSLPLIPFDSSKLIIDKGSLEAGKVNFLNQGDLKNLLNYITPISDNRMTIWFTPMYFKYAKDILNLSRFDMLVANLYPLACWGNWDLNAKKFNLVLGLSASTLNQAFGVQGLDEDFILQLPLKGKNGQVQIDKTKLIGKISALVAKMKGGEKGNLFGDLLNFVVEDRSESATPQPTTKPFPWQKELNASEKNRKPSKPVDLPDTNPKKPGKNKDKKSKKDKKHSKEEKSIVD